MTSTTHLGNTIKHAMGNFCKALLCMACVTALAGHARAQENPASPGNANPDWIPYNGKIENIDPGKYDIIFREVDTECLSNTETFEINLLEKPAAPVVQEIIQPTCVLHTGSVVLSALPEGNWIINPGNISGSGQTTTITDLVAGQSYAFTVTTSDECTSEPSVLVPINPAPFTPEPPSAEAQTLCAGSRVENLIEQYPSGTELRWYTTDQGGSALASGTELETNTYYAAAVSIDGCESTRVAVSVFVNPIVPPVVSITANKTEICDGDEVIFTAEVSENVTAVNYQWLLNDEPTGDNSSTFTSATLNNDDKIRCSVSVTGTCVSETPVLSDVYTVSVSEKITVVAKDDTQCGDLIGSFTALGLDPNKQYEYQLIPKSQVGKPVITLLGDNPLYLNVGETFIDPGATALDGKDGDITSDIVTVSTVDVNNEGTYQVTYNVTDSDGNVAEEVVRVVNILSDEVTIGTQTWKVKNLDIDDGQSGIYVYGGNDNNPDYDYNLATYGRLYTWDAAMRVAASIDGWHLPNNVEWQALSKYLGGDGTSGGKLKEIGTFHWDSSNTGATNESNFTALPGGCWDGGHFHYIREHCYLLSSDIRGNFPCLVGLLYDSKMFGVYSTNRDVAMSVRLIKDYSHTPTITLLGNNPITINVGDTYTDAGVTASDARYGDISADIVTENIVNTAVAGTYTVTYNVTTEDGYSAVEVVRTVNVIPSAPQFEEVTIGTQTWMVRNLDIDDGLGGIYVYGGNENNPDYEYNLATYGRLYTLSAAMRVASSIDGWHLPSEAEFDALRNYLGRFYSIGAKLKETGFEHWEEPNTDATNTSGFTALGSGCANTDLKGNYVFRELKITFCMWSTTTYTGRILGYDNNRFYNYYVVNLPDFLMSVRLIKD